MALGLKIWVGHCPVAPSIPPCRVRRPLQGLFHHIEVLEPKHEILKLLCLLLNQYESAIKWLWSWKVYSFVKSNSKRIIFVMNQKNWSLNFVTNPSLCHKKAQNLFPYIYGINHIIFAYIQLFNYWNSSSEKETKTRGHGLIFLSLFFRE